MRHEEVVILVGELGRERNAPDDVSHVGAAHARERAVRCRGHMEIGALVLVTGCLSHGKGLRLRDGVGQRGTVLNVEHPGDTLGLRSVEVWQRRGGELDRGPSTARLPGLSASP